MRRFFAVLLALSLGLSTLPALAAARPMAPAIHAAASLPEQATKKPSLEGIDAFISEVMKEWKVPGLAIAVVQDGKIILSQGYGLRDVKNNLPVTPKTLFAIGSITKSFTVTGLGILNDQGKLDWDKPAREYLPTFRLYDPVASEHMTARDLVTHRSGLPRHDFLWYNSGFNRKEMFDRLRYLEPSKEFRSTWQYQNLMFMTAGYLAGQLAGLSWEDFTRQKILLPLGMRGSNFSVLDSQKTADFALPYAKVKEDLREIPFRVIDEIGPAGSINSSVEDMANYVLLHLNKGKHGQTQLVSENNVTQMQTPQMVMPGATPYAEVGHSSYGMALVVSTYRGHKAVSHGGGIDGFTALLSFMPQDNIGMIILSNRSGNPVPTIVSYNIYDRLLGLEPVAWSQRIQEQQKKQEQAEEEAKKKGFTTRKEGTRPSHDLKEYAGEYEHPGYGVAWVELEKDELKLVYNKITSPLKHFHYDVFEVPEDPLNPFQERKVRFTTDLKGEIDSLLVLLEPNVKEIVFTRMPEKAMKERKFLEALVGQYQLASVTVTFSLKGENTLTLTVPGQPEYEMVPVRGLTFDVKGLAGFSIEFKKDASGAVIEAAFYQPNGTFLAKKK